MAFKTINGTAPGPGARMATKPAGKGGTAKQGQIMSGSKESQIKRDGSSVPAPPKPKVGKGGNGQFTHPKGNY